MGPSLLSTTHMTLGSNPIGKNDGMFLSPKHPRVASIPSVQEMANIVHGSYRGRKEAVTPLVHSDPCNLHLKDPPGALPGIRKKVIKTN